LFGGEVWVSRRVTVRVLGPVDLAVDRRSVVVPPLERALMAVLALAGGAPVPAETIIAALWGESPPPAADGAVADLVIGLRAELCAAGADPDVLITDVPGYLLNGSSEADLQLFAELITQARGYVAVRDWEPAHRAYSRALALWRGAALAGLTAPFADIEAARLEELRLGVIEERFDVDLRLGRQVEIIDGLDAMVSRYPLRGRLRGQLMLALYRLGRKDEALAAFDHVRNELGLEPDSKLRQLHLAMITGHPSLLGPRPRPPVD
jgi:DNA-binding SARP family transcriptional activator